MSILQASVVERVRFYLGDHAWEDIGDALDATSSVFVGNGDDWAKGDLGEFVEDGDTYRVQEVLGDELDSVRSYYGSTGAAHTGARILKNPKYHYSEITNAITSVINFELPWPRIYMVETAQIDPDTVSHPVTADSWYALPSDALGLVNVSQISDQTPARKLEYGLLHTPWPIRFQRDLPLALVNTSVGVSFENFRDTDNTIYVTYARSITDTVSSGFYEDLDTGDAVVEAIVLGAVALLQSALELRKGRHDAQNTDNLRSGSYFGGLYKKALATAEKQIHKEHPLITPLRSTR